MNKMQMAHEWAIELLRTGDSSDDVVSCAWRYADAMQAEAEKREDKERPAVLCEVDWRQSPDDAIGWMIFDGASTWLGADGYLIENAPSFGFTGSHLVERPQ